MAKLKIMQPLDTKVLSLTEKLKNNSEYLKIQDQFSGLDDQSQSVIKTLLPFVLMGIPFIIALILWGNNTSLKDETQLKKNIISKAQEIIAIKASVANAENRVLGTGLIEQVEQYQQKIVNAIATVAIDTSNIKLSNFSTTPLAGDISEAKVDLKFTGLSNEQLFGMITTLTRNKMRVDTTQIRKSTENNLLDGLLTLIFFSRDISTGE